MTTEETGTPRWHPDKGDMYEGAPDSEVIRQIAQRDPRTRLHTKQRYVWLSMATAVLIIVVASFSIRAGDKCKHYKSSTAHKMHTPMRVFFYISLVLGVLWVGVTAYFTFNWRWAWMSNRYQKLQYDVEDSDPYYLDRSGMQGELRGGHLRNEIEDTVDTVYDAVDNMDTYSTSYA